jgi:hypothetical protein
MQLRVNRADKNSRKELERQIGEMNKSGMLTPTTNLKPIKLQRASPSLFTHAKSAQSIAQSVNHDINTRVLTPRHACLAEA